MSEISYEVFERDVLQNEMISVIEDNYVRFSGKTQNYCIGFVDIVNSTKIAAKIKPTKLGMYYSIFLNSMSKIVEKFGAVVVKNMGDSILFYFPMPIDQKMLANVIECGKNMIESRCRINTLLINENLPTVKFRVSLDYGTVSTAFSSSSSVEDIFGPAVNVCVKINHSACANGMVIGSDLYRMLKQNSKYKFSESCSFSSGLKNEYLVYSLL